MHPELLHEIAQTRNAEARELAARRQGTRQAPSHGKRPTLRLARFAIRRGVRVA
jgi:hypothetical protein